MVVGEEREERLQPRVKVTADRRWWAPGPAYGGQRKLKATPRLKLPFRSVLIWTGDLQP